MNAGVSRRRGLKTRSSQPVLQSSPSLDDELTATAEPEMHPGLLALPLQVTLHRDEASLPRYESAWADLAGDVPFLRPDWALTWWRHYRTADMSLCVLTVTDAAGDLVGLAPWYVQRSLLGGREIRFLGDGEVCSDYLSLVCRPGSECAVGEHIADWLGAEGSREFDALYLSGAAAGDPAIDALVARCAAQQAWIDERVLANAWRTQLTGDWETYVQGLSRSRRERVRQICRKQLDTPRATWRQVDSPAAIQQGWEIFVDLHQRRRASLNQPGCFASQRFAAFHREMFQRWQPAGLARIHWTELDGQPVVVHYDLIGPGGTVFLYQTGMEPARAADGPGTLGIIAALRSSIAAGYSGYDFLRGDEDYKAYWRTTARPILEYRITPRRGLASARRRWRMFVASAKQSLKNRFAKPGVTPEKVT